MQLGLAPVDRRQHAEAMSPWPKRSSGQSAVSAASIPASSSAWCQARAVRTSPKSRTDLPAVEAAGRRRGPASGRARGAGASVRGSQSRRGPSQCPACRFVELRARPRAAARSSTGAGRAGERVGAGGGLGEGDHVADRVGAGEALDDAVDPVGDAAVRRRAVAQRLEQEAEARLGLLRVDPERGEDLLLHLGVADTDRAAAHLLPVPDDVVGLRPRARPGSSGSNSPAGAVKGWCSGSQRCSSSFAARSAASRRSRAGGRSPSVDQAEALGRGRAAAAPSTASATLRLVGDQQQQVALLGAEPLG